MSLGKLTLKDMRLARSEIKEDDAPEQPAFPWGLSLSLDQHSLEKLGLDKLPDVDDIFFVVAVARVNSVSEHKSQDGDSSQNVGLQIEQLSLDPKVNT